MYIKFFSKVHEALLESNLIGALESTDSDQDLVYQAADVVWDVYCSEDLADKDLPVLSHVYDADDGSYTMYVFEGGVYVNVVAHAGEIYLDTSGPSLP